MPAFLGGRAWHSDHLREEADVCHHRGRRETTAHGAPNENVPRRPRTGALETAERLRTIKRGDLFEVWEQPGTKEKPVQPGGSWRWG